MGSKRIGSAIGALAVTLALAASSLAAASTTRSLRPVGVGRGVVVFAVSGLTASHVVRAEVRAPGFRRGVSAQQLRSARHGRLRVRAPRAVIRRAAQKPAKSGHVQLVVVLDPPATDPVPASSDAGSTTAPATTSGATAPTSPGSTSPAAGPTSASPTPAGTPQSTWTPVHTLPLSDAAAAALVTHRAENRPANAAANSYQPTDAQLQAFRTTLDKYGETPAQWNPLYAYVTGRPGLTDPSTDDLVQWTAHKWGIPEDWIRAEMAVESWWNQSQLGDRATVSSAWYGLYPAQSRIAGTSDVYESLGVMQVKWRPDANTDPGTEPLRWQSTAFNLDYYGATIRYYYDGYCSWCTSGYSAGQQWNSIGAWYQPSPWTDSSAQTYVSRVQSYLADRVWAQPGF